MRNNGDEIRISTSHTTLRAIGFVIALVVAVCAFSFGIASIGNKEPGYYDVEATANEQAERYALGFTLTLYFDGESNAIKEQMARAQEVYSAALLRAYMLLDTENTYDGVVNLATLNASLGQRVQVSDELCAVLADAWNKTQQGRGYSLVAGALIREWESILTLSDAAEYDPLRNADSAARIHAVYERTVQPGVFDLTIEGNTVCLRVAQDYLAFLQENEYDGGVLNTNLLHDAYLLSIVRDALEAEGFADGYLTADSGITVALSAHRGSGAYCFYSTVDDEAAQTATVAIRPATAASLLRSFPLEEGEFMYYSVGDVHRSSVAALGSDASATLLQSCLAVHDDVVQAAYDALTMMLTDEQATPNDTAAEAESTLVYAVWSADMLYANSADVLPSDGVSIMRVG